jgi:hypothetical protein
MNKSNRPRSVILNTSLRLVILIFLVGSGCRPVPGLSDDVYVAVDGSDARDCFTPANACATIGRALMQVNRGGVIHLGPGDHESSVTISITKLVTLQGEGAGVTVLSPVSPPDGTEYLHIPDGSGLILRELTLSGARLAFVESRLYFGIQNFGLLDIQNCILQDFAAGSSGAVRSDGVLLVSDSLFTGNLRAVDAVGRSADRSMIQRTGFVSNVSALVNSGPLMLNDVEFIGNGAGFSPGEVHPAVTNTNTGSLRINGVRFEGSLGAAILNEDGDSSLTLMEGDISGSGGAALEVSGGRVSISTSFLHDNAGPGILMSAGTIEVERATLANNGADGIEFQGGDGLTLTDVVIRDNQGSGLFTLPVDSAAILVTRTAIVRNLLDGLVADEGIALTLDTSTVSANRSGIRLAGGSLQLSDSTVVRNNDFAVDAISGSEIGVARSVVALSGGPADCSLDDTAVTPQLSVWCDNTLSQSELGLGDLTEENLTFVHPILDPSGPLHNGGGGGCADLDQRMAGRPALILCDIGAYELQSVTTSLEGTSIALATVTPAGSGPEVTFIKNAFCRKGPGTYYDILASFELGAISVVEGRNEDSSWWFMDDPNSDAGCWASATTVETSVSPEAVVVMSAPPLPDPVEGFYLDDFDCDVGNKKYTLALWWLDGEGELGYRLYRNGDELRPLRVNTDHFIDDDAPLFEELLYELEAYNEYGASERRYVDVPACQ